MKRYLFFIIYWSDVLGQQVF